MNTINLIRSIRSIINRTILPADKVLLNSRNTKPASRKFGYDRGTPIDRYWIEDFLEKNKMNIKGVVLEVTDNRYTVRYGSKNVTKSDVLDINPKNKKANIICDLRDLSKKVKNDTYDCIILTHVLGLIDNYETALTECYRILKKDGVLIFTGSSFGPILGDEEVHWRFNRFSAKYILGKVFGNKNVVVVAYGNALAGQALWAGLSQEDLSSDQLSVYDPQFPCMVGAIAKK